MPVLAAQAVEALVEPDHFAVLVGKPALVAIDAVFTGAPDSLGPTVLGAPGLGDLVDVDVGPPSAAAHSRTARLLGEHVLNVFLAHWPGDDEVAALLDRIAPVGGLVDEGELRRHQRDHQPVADELGLFLDRLLG